VDWKAWLVLAIIGFGAAGAVWDKRRSRRRKEFLTEEQAKTIIEEEIRKRGWDGYDQRSYELEHRKGRPVWVCWGLAKGKIGPSMAIHIDARTGEVVTAVAGGR
jgi:hypothetical protein